jgi:ABC-type phosphate transport system ATPase subunit
MRQLSNYTIVIVTHNMAQAACFDFTAMMMLTDDKHRYGDRSRADKDLFLQRKDQRTEGYVTGRYG